jgi:hypothetical protein
MIRTFRDPGAEDIVFVWTELGPAQVEIVDYHD